MERHFILHYQEREIEMQIRKILLAEDNRNDVELTLEALTDINLANTVTVVRDGVETLEYLRCEGAYEGREGGHPAVILLDIKTPRKDGLEVLAEIRADEKLSMIPVVLLTSSREEQDLIKGYKLGANAYVVKPVDFNNFTESIRQIGAFWALINELPPEQR
jgi:CheY-like chemotaxis protein